MLYCSHCGSPAKFSIRGGLCPNCGCKSLNEVAERLTVEEWKMRHTAEEDTKPKPVKEASKTTRRGADALPRNYGCDPTTIKVVMKAPDETDRPKAASAGVWAKWTAIDSRGGDKLRGQIGKLHARNCGGAGWFVGYPKASRDPVVYSPSGDPRTPGKGSSLKNALADWREKYPDDTGHLEEP